MLLLMAFVIWTAQFFWPIIFGFDEGDLLTQEFQKITGKESDEVKMEKIKANIKNSNVISEMHVGNKIIKQQYLDNHFHHVGFEIKEDKTNACVYCHGQVPHEKDPETRSFLNMHSFSVACESCHVVAEKGKGKWGFAWYGINNGEIVSSPTMLVEENIFKGPFGNKNKKYYPTGNYGAKIAPGYISDGDFELLSTDDDLNIAEDYMQEHQEMSESERKTAKKEMHKSLKKEALECDYCHGDEKGYIPYEKLGYPPRRVRQLTDSAIVGLISKYERFYFPNFMEGSGRRK